MSFILIIEDESMLADTLREVLEDEGHDALTASNGEEALRLLADKSPELVLLDLMLPRMDGLAFLAARAKDSRLRSIPVVVMSSASRAVVRDHAVAGFLSKPFRLDALLHLISATLHEPDRTG
ncbi:MAG TPA: response regulator [Myxococcus sp.]|nr:response regulator [Myxococcus sp.]